MTEQVQERVDDAVLKYLRYYCDPKNELDYAVMVKGKWGAGKTYLINSFIEELKTSGRDKVLYVSLYGLTSSRQIDEALYRQLHPVLSSKGMKLAATIGKAVLKAATRIDFSGDGKEDVTITSGIPDVDLMEYFKTPNECILIFDDLERCSMEVSDILGYINSFVEHEGFKAIVVANEEEILKRDDTRYAEIKEKLIGQTLSLKSDVAAALNRFLTLVKHQRAKEHLQRNDQTIRLIYSQSGTDNLRLLKHALWDFEKLASCLTEKHWDNHEAIGILARSTIALSVETRSGRLSQEDLVRAAIEPAIRLFRKPDDPKTPLDKLKERYPEIEFDQKLLSPDLLTKLFFEGSIGKDQTRSALDASPFYASPSAPAWKIAWHGWQTTDERYEEAVQIVEEQFRKRDFLVLGELLQVFGLRLVFSGNGVIQKAKEDVVAECKTYIDDLRKAGKLPDADVRRSEDRPQSWDGLGFFEIGTREFEEISEYLCSSIKEASRDRLPAKGHQLMELMKTDVQAFFRKLCLNNVEASPFFDVPVLASINAETFVDEVLRLEPSAQGSVFAMFRGRYDRLQLEGDLHAEKSWLERVKAAFEARMLALRPMSKDRLKNRIGHSIDPLLTKDPVKQLESSGDASV